MALADQSAVWTVVKALQKELYNARVGGNGDKVRDLQRRLMIWILKAIAQERISNPVALAQAAVDEVEPRLSP